jgi:hypothetical protein
MDPIKTAFQRVKEDLLSIEHKIQEHEKITLQNRERLIELCDILSLLVDQNKTLIDTNNEIEKRFTHYDSILKNLVTTLSHLTDKLEKGSDGSSTHISLEKTPSTHIQTDKQPFKPGNDQYIGISKGNEGVPTDRQTDQQTDQQTDRSSHNQEKNPVDNAVEILDSLDNIKKEIRLKFKRLTEQELLVFSTIYQLEEQEGNVDYRVIANKLNLTESSIRDYVGRLLKKGIPVDKIKVNNKSIQLSISKNLKKIAPLSTILQLRDL